MELHGKSIIHGKPTGSPGAPFAARAAAGGSTLAPAFFEATEADVDRALRVATDAFDDYQSQGPEKIATFVDRIAQELLALGDELIQRANAETALPEARLTGERARTVNQLRMFAQVVREGSWVEARLDRAQPDRQPIPKPDLRRMLIPIGPVVVFSASNFPLAFSVAGGDTASALAAGNPVIVKAHPAHPGTSELAARAIVAAVEATGMPPGVFALLQGPSHELGHRLVVHPLTRAVAFTGSEQGGRALFDAAAARPEPVPVYAEMGSTNPVFVLPGALEENPASLAQGLMQSVTLGVGQFCTNPGLVFGIAGSAFERLGAEAGKIAVAAPAGTMLNGAVCERFRGSVEKARKLSAVQVLGAAGAELKEGQAGAVVLRTELRDFLNHPALQEEMFGPATLLVSCGSAEELERAASELPGQLTVTIHGTEQDLLNHQRLVRILQQKAGRVLFNGFPTGVEVCPSMHHGGPYPATTHSHFTSVGTAAIKRFARPVCFQNFPHAALPPELRDRNLRKIWREVDGVFTKDDLAA
jgi:2,5-dioxopentanoate dehydrogenase